MGTITTGVGLISGIDTASIIDQLIALEALGKVPIQNRITSLQNKQLALLDINARLLNLKTASASFRTDSIFKSALATSSNEDVLTVTAGKLAQPGNFSFIVKQLVTSSQKLSQGFVDKNTTPLGLTTMSFEFGNGLVSPDTDLIDLNGGAGVDRGKILITDRSGKSATIDLTATTTINEVIKEINDAAILVTASTSGDGLVITDNTGDTTSNLIVAEVGSDTTAADLGIVQDIAAATFNGSAIRTLGTLSSLKSLNDGNGVLIKNNNYDLQITTRNGVIYDIDLGRIDEPITDETKLIDLNNGDGISITKDSTDFTIRTSTGVLVDIDLGELTDENGNVTDSEVTTVLDLINRVNTQLAADDDLVDGNVVMSINANADGFVITDNLFPGGNTLAVLKGIDDTAKDLGIEAVDGINAETGDEDDLVDGIITGSIVPNLVQDNTAVTIQDVIDRINNAEEADGTPNGGHIVASLALDGVSLLITDTVGGGTNLIITGAITGPSAAAHLGIEANVAAATVDGTRIVSGINSVLINSLNGGAGLSGNDSLTIQDRDGDSETFDLSTAESLSDIIDQINNVPPGNNFDITASINSKGTGITITEFSGNTAFNFTISGSAAAELNIAADLADGEGLVVEGTNLQKQYVSEASKLTDLNYGRGIATGSFTITDGYNNSETVNIGSDSVTLYDVMQEINSRGIAITARINDNGDGLYLEHDPLNASPSQEDNIPFVRIKVESQGSTIAADLNILGEATDVMIDPLTDDGNIDGSYENVVTLEATDTLEDVVSKINKENIPISASIINSSTGATPFHLTLTSNIAGRAGELIVDSDVDLGFTTLTQAQDAKVFFGTTDPSSGFLIQKNSNTIDDVVQGVTIDLVSASDSPVTITVKRDVATIVESVKNFVTTFNDAIGRINDYDSYNPETEERGPLLSDPTVSRLRDALHRQVQGKALGLTTQFQFLSSVGIRIANSGKLAFDQGKFDAAYAADPDAVENLFAAFESTAVTEKDLGGGVKVLVTDEDITQSGFGDLFDQLLKGLTDPIDGTVTLADEAFGDQITLAQKRLERFDERLEVKRERLERQFLAMELALAQLQNQASALNSISNNIALANRRP